MKRKNNILGGKILKQQNSNAAFTLAEVLITLGIIGVVAALTLPALIHNYRKSVVENKLKSEFSLISNAIRMAESKNGTAEDWNTCDEAFSLECTNNFFDSYLGPELKVVKLCNNGNNEECWSGSVSLSGKKGYLRQNSDMAISAILENGSSIYLWLGGQLTSPHVQIWFDIDGPTKGKSMLGYDIFGMQFFFKGDRVTESGTYLKSGLYMVGNYHNISNVDELKSESQYGCSKDITRSTAGRYCGALIQYYGWKIPKDYPISF